jgi:hypothetical protein
MADLHDRKEIDDSELMNWIGSHDD